MQFSLSVIAAAGVLLNAGVSSAHGIVQDLKIGSDWWKGSLVYQDPYQNPVPSRVVWPFFGAGNGPVTDVSSSGIVCNKLSGKGALTAPVAAGSQVTFYWDTWPDSHKGPVMTYLASCGNTPCKDIADPSSLSYFKIHHDGWNGQSWASDRLIQNNFSVSLTIPSDIAPGNYLMRHELLALHEGFLVGGAQFYPMCTNLQITGSGSATPQGVSFPGAYSSSDPGINCNIYNNFNPNNYVIPGPAVYSAGSGSGSGSGSSSTPVSSSAPATSSSSTPTSLSVSSSPEITQPPASCPTLDYEPDVRTFTYSDNGIEITQVITVTAKVKTVTVTV